jgi:hypothetical protein
MFALKLTCTPQDLYVEVNCSEELDITVIGLFWFWQYFYIVLKALFHLNDMAKRRRCGIQAKIKEASSHAWVHALNLRASFHAVGKRCRSLCKHAAVSWTQPEPEVK